MPKLYRLSDMADIVALLIFGAAAALITLMAFYIMIMSRILGHPIFEEIKERWRKWRSTHRF